VEAQRSGAYQLVAEHDAGACMGNNITRALAALDADDP
jgi:hypothetical protein